MIDANERYGFLRLPLQKHEAVSSREDGEQRLESLRNSGRLHPDRRASVGTNGHDFWIDYTRAK
jgi:hypothetical protein